MRILVLVMSMLLIPTSTSNQDALRLSTPTLTQELTLEEEIDQAVTDMSTITGISPDLIHGIIRTESNGNPTAESWYGAVGLMQVVPWLHLGDFPECGDDLTDVFTNICYGTSILEYKLQLAGGNKRRALLYFNGCWGETYQPGCETYPDKVAERGGVEID